MKSTFAMVLLLGIVCMVLAEKYPAKYDQVNIDNVLSNDRVLTNYIKCLLDKGACTREGRELKKLLPDALQSDCSKCSAAQKRNSKKVINFLRTRRPNDWKDLTAKFDPEGLFKQRLDAGLV
ncbi:ejaculatory bulb-specific protein 3-like [Contarinia nasturtii]|uniref:ejaculatory bulb-specific protein 3-like n=1 Tax=Contarinia nasturtii TaxID=265458 RepID=UPI0012D3DA9B|nr:ejaculatory bulb-specific protein 3-like [Contarinia nasturtii]